MNESQRTGSDASGASAQRAGLDLPLLASWRPRTAPRRSKRGPWRAAALIAVHVAALVHIAHWRIAGESMTPLEPSEAGQTLELGYVNAGLVLLLVAILATLLFGRFFCGWACHVIAYQDLASWLARRVGWQPRPVRSRGLALVPFAAAAIVFGEPLLRRLAAHGSLPDFVPHFKTTEFWGTFPGFWMGAATFAVDGFLLVWFLGAKGFCTYACPYGALFGVADRVAPGRIRVTDACEGCGHCTATCSSNVRVHEEVARFGQVVDAGCMKCLDCVSVCPKDALYFGRTSSGRAAERVRRTPRWGRRTRRTWDLSWPEELLAAGAFVGGLYAFRLAYNAVPLMLALGLAVFVALGALLAVRLVVRADVALQGRVLKRARRFSTAGGVVFAATVAWLAFALHTGVQQALSGSGQRALERASTLAGSERAAAIDDAARTLQRAAGWGLFTDSAVENQRGQIAFARGEFDAAAASFERALDAHPRLLTARRMLAEVELRRGNPAGAEAALRALLEREPDDPEALQKLALVLLNDEARRFAAEPLLERLVVAARAAGDRERERFALESLATLRSLPRR